MKIFLFSFISLLVGFTAQAQNTRPLYIGERVFNVQRDSATVTVVGQEPYGTYILRFEDGPLTGQVGGNWSRADLAVMDGCGAYQNCVGDTVINNERDWAYARVAGVQVDGRVVLQFTSGPLNGGKGGNWNAQALSQTHGCGRTLCVGQRAYNIQRNYALTQVVGIQFDGRYVLQFLNGPNAGGTGGNWNDIDLALAP
jgi:hypothetical protein